jgi:capsular polysaccharide biosynthesis protein
VELRIYGQILRRRIWLVMIVVALTGIAVAYQFYQAHKAAAANQDYQTSVTMHIGLQSANHAQNDSDYVNTVANLTDEFASGPTLTSPSFANQVIQQIQNHTSSPQGYTWKDPVKNWQDPTNILSALTVTHAHSIITVVVDWHSEMGAWAIARAVGEVCEANMPSYLNYQVDSSPAYLVPVAKVIAQPSKPVLSTKGSSTKTTQLLAILLVGLILGLALAFLVEYLDDRIYRPEEIGPLLGLPIYGEIPRASAK